MKNKAIISTILLTVIFVSFMLGISFGRKTSSPVFEIPDNTTLDTHSHSLSGTETLPGNGIININTATAEDLTLLPGIGPVLAQSIIRYRQTNGLFRSVDDLLDVSGIGEKKLNGIIDYITVGG